MEITATAIINDQQATAGLLAETQPRSFFKFENVKFAYEPFPIGLVTPIMEEGLYSELLNSYPDISLFKSMPYLGSKESVKYSLAELNNGEDYHKFLDTTQFGANFMIG